MRNKGTEYKVSCEGNVTPKPLSKLQAHPVHIHGLVSFGVVSQPTPSIRGALSKQSQVHCPS